MQPSSPFQGWQCRVRITTSFRLVCSGMFVAEFQEEVRTIIRNIVKRLGDSASDSDIHMTAIELFSTLAVQGMC